MSRLFLIGCGLLLFASGAAAETQPATSRKLTLTPARPPSPALHLALLPELRHQAPGDAWPLYKMASQLQQKRPEGENDGINQLLQHYAERPLAELRRDDVRRLLESYREIVALLEKAAARERCDGDLAQRLREKGYYTPLEYEQHLRYSAVLLCLKARLELAEGSPEAAVRTLRGCYVLGKRLGEAPCLMCLLIGASITNQANRVLEEIIAHPQSPNLYWSLASLPQPFFDLRPGLEGEQLMAFGQFPGLRPLRSAEAAPMTAEQVQESIRAIILLQQKADTPVNRFTLGTLVQSKHGQAKKALLAAGLPRDRVESWPHVQIALLHWLLEYDRVLDALRKGQTLPYHQVAARVQEVEAQIAAWQRPNPDGPAIHLTWAQLDSIVPATVAQLRIERDLAALRCLEALRLHAAGKGQLPAALDDVKDVPVPLCPLTGKSFEYRLEGDRAILTTPPLPGKNPADKLPLVYEIRLRR